jgi:hypothetical protein
VSFPPQLAEQLVYEIDSILKGIAGKEGVFKWLLAGGSRSNKLDVNDQFSRPVKPTVLAP